jgi:hypothetical protein
VVIAGKAGLYVLQLNADGLETQKDLVSSSTYWAEPNNATAWYANITAERRLTAPPLVRGRSSSSTPSSWSDADVHL